MGEVIVLVTPARLSIRGTVVGGFIAVPEHERLDAEDARRLAQKLNECAARLEGWDEELVPVLRREADINERFLGTGG